MKRTHWITPFLGFVAALTLASCDSTAPTGVDTAPADAEVRRNPTRPGRGLGDLTLLSCSPLPADSASEAIGPEGGTIEVGPHRFFVPEGALDSTVTITAIMPSGTADLVRFYPEGLHFERSTYLTMSYAHCGVLSWLLPRWIVHVDGSLNILELLPSLPDLFHQRVTARVDHFSDYAVAW